MNLQAWSFTHPGHARRTNEDALLVRAPEGLFVVADGMGGHADGEVASRLCVETIAKPLEVLSPLAALPPNHPVQERWDAVHAAITVANEVVYDESKRRRNDMGTTVAALLFAPGVAIMGHVGDSRVYLMRSGKVFCLTTDHSLGEALLARGDDPDDVAHNPRREMLLRAIGIERTVDISMKAVYVQPGDVLLVCTDGVYRELEHDIGNVIRCLNDPNPGEALLSALMATPCRDNITAIVVKVS